MQAGVLKTGSSLLLIFFWLYTLCYEWNCGKAVYQLTRTLLKKCLPCLGCDWTHTLDAHTTNCCVCFGSRLVIMSANYIFLISFPFSSLKVQLKIKFLQILMFCFDLSRSEALQFVTKVLDSVATCRQHPGRKRLKELQKYLQLTLVTSSRMKLF